ncbi:MAG: hypothetical protein QF600_00505 [Verrucomicrobiota bacterium]|nr:hypothetical protein [Verrucomicrobiota bacterium]
MPLLYSVGSAAAVPAVVVVTAVVAAAEVEAVAAEAVDVTAHLGGTAITAN